MRAKHSRVHLQHSLPYCELQRAELGGFYYKAVSRLHQNQPALRMRLGVKIGEFGHAQQDHVAYLTQSLNSSTSPYKLALLGTHFLYLQRADCLFQPSQEDQHWFIQDERRIFQELCAYAETLATLLREELSGCALLSSSFSAARLSQKIGALVSKMESAK